MSRPEQNPDQPFEEYDIEEPISQDLTPSSFDENTGVDLDMEDYVRRSIEALDHIEPMDF